MTEELVILVDRLIDEKITLRLMIDAGYIAPSIKRQRAEVERVIRAISGLVAKQATT